MFADAGMRKLSPDAMLAELKKALEKWYDDVTVGLPIVHCALGDEDEVASFDIVPAVEHVAGGYEIPDRISGGWIRTNPKVHAEEATAKNGRCDGRWKPLVKMIKGWNREAGKPIKPSSRSR